MQNQPQKSTAIFIRTSHAPHFCDWSVKTIGMTQHCSLQNLIQMWIKCLVFVCQTNGYIVVRLQRIARIKSKEATPWMHRCQHHPPNRSLITHLMTATRGKPRDSSRVLSNSRVHDLGICKQRVANCPSECWPSLLPRDSTSHQRCKSHTPVRIPEMCCRMQNGSDNSRLSSYDLNRIRSRNPVFCGWLTSPKTARGFFSRSTIKNLTRSNKSCGWFCRRFTSVGTGLSVWHKGLKITHIP